MGCARPRGVRSLLPAVLCVTMTACGAEALGPEDDVVGEEGDGDGKADTLDPTRPLPADPRAPGFTRYPAEALRSPITASVAERMHQIAARRERDDRVFMKVGASGTVSRNLLYCAAGESPYRVDLGTHEGLQATLDGFRGGDAAGTTPFDRVTLAAQIGKTAKWVMTGSPSPLTRETSALDPRFAFVNYGTNDMELASSYAAALPLFAENLERLLDTLESGGIVPIVSGLNPRTDRAEATRWVPTFDAVTRGLVEARQLSYLSLYRAGWPLADHGLGGDGLHGTAYSEGGTTQPCVFTESALAWSYNLRNLLSIEALDAARRIVVEGDVSAETPPLAPVTGSGSAADPFVIDRLPFSHAYDTTRGVSAVGRYACSGSHQGGPEIHYRLDLSAGTPVRAVVLDRGSVDVDVHLISAGGDCLARGDSIADTTLSAERHEVVVDTYVSAETPRAGRYLLVVLACESGDAACD
jgi:hypothetical protein